MKWCNLKINFIWRTNWLHNFSILRSIFETTTEEEAEIGLQNVLLLYIASNLTGGWQNLNWWNSTTKIPSASHLLWYIFWRLFEVKPASQALKTLIYSEESEVCKSFAREAAVQFSVDELISKLNYVIGKYLVKCKSQMFESNANYIVIYLHNISNHYF